VAPEEAPAQGEVIQLLFERGDCIGIQADDLDALVDRLNIRELVTGAEGDYLLLTPLGVMRILNALGGRHGVGRVDMVENRFVGMKSRGVYETPGGAILFVAHRQIESITMDREVMHLRDGLIPHYSTLVYNGFWFAPEREALQALVTESQRNVSGEVRLRLYRGNVLPAGRRSAVSLYHPEMATMEADPTEAYNQSDATGFIRLNGLRLRVAAKVQTGRGL